MGVEPMTSDIRHQLINHLTSSANDRIHTYSRHFNILRLIFTDKVSFYKNDVF